MQRLCSKLRSFPISSLSSSSSLPRSSPRLHRSLHFSSNTTHSWSSSRSVFNAHSTPLLVASLRSSTFPISMVQVRYVSSRERKNRRKPMTPVTSKIKKVKIKGYSSYKSRFRLLNDGTIRRWREGKRHNAHLKSKISKRRLRQPALVHPAYATVMKKLGFCA
ncbi:uncharacterized protein LOC126793839 [Argentina anserina]|uniref:uncharacterized protein LOC126793839 n=1 Tax=Argentina anserina TaxID=57926 RepID=UPI0021765767|nr:uncharacterized protein LOC126793839 [Potentilla anserina]